MGQSTDGQICYGFLFEEGHVFPWDDEKYDGPEEWWREVNEYENPEPNPFTPEGEYAEGFTDDDPRTKAYFKHIRYWEEDHPLPFEMVNVCSGDFPQYILAIPGTVTRANRGYPVEINPISLGDFSVEMMQYFCISMEKFGHGPKSGAEPAWYLSSYWG